MAPSDTRRRLVGFGLAIESDRGVPGALPDRSAGIPDLRIATLPPLAPVQSAPLYRWADGTLTFSAPGVARYACRTDSIHIAAAPDADPDMVTALLIATALPAISWLRGGTMLHAAGLVGPLGALAIAGPSGVGKSTLAAQLLDEGAMLLADDSICLRRNGDRIEGTGLPGGYHLADAARTFCTIPVSRSVRRATIGAVLVLARSDAAASLARLSPVAALERLLANQHRPAVPAILGRRAGAFATMAFIARNCAVYEWHRPSAALGMAEREMLAREGLW